MKMIKNMDREHLFGAMVENIQENGKKVNNMERESLLNQEESKEKVNGLMVEDKDGWMKLLGMDIMLIIDNKDIFKFNLTFLL